MIYEVICEKCGMHYYASCKESFYFCDDCQQNELEKKRLETLDPVVTWNVFDFDNAVDIIKKLKSKTVTIELNDGSKNEGLFVAFLIDNGNPVEDLYGDKIKPSYKYYFVLRLDKTITFGCNKIKKSKLSEPPKLVNGWSESHLKKFRGYEIENIGERKL